MRVANCVGVLLLFGSKPKLLQQAQIIVAVPVLDYPAPFDSADGDACLLYPPPSGRAKLFYLPLVGTAEGEACDSLVTFCYLVINGYVQIWECGFVPGDEPLEFLYAMDLLIWQVPDRIRSVNLVEDVQVIRGFSRAAH